LILTSVCPARPALIVADMSQKARVQVRDVVFELLTGNDMPEDLAEKLAGTLSEGRWTHDFPITAKIAGELGLNVSTDLPSEVQAMLALYPQPRGRRPSVEFIPAPYGPRPGPADRRTARE
jgi:ClpP class serine protease